MRQKNTITSPATTSNSPAPPLPACPGCGMVKNSWPGEGYTHEGETFCCQGCAEGTGCTCATLDKSGFSREGQQRTRAAFRLGEQRSGAPAPARQLGDEPDSRA